MSQQHIFLQRPTIQSLEQLDVELARLGITVLRRSEETDIDCYTDRALKDVVKDLVGSGLILVTQEDSFLEYILPAQDRFVAVEVANTLFRGTAFRRARVRQGFVARYVRDPVANTREFRILKALLCLRDRSLLADTDKAEIEQLITADLVWSPYRRTAGAWGIPSTSGFILMNARVPAIVDRYLSLLRACLSHYRRSRTMAIIGPDGVGKSTVIARLATYDGMRPIYMGMRDFRFGALIRALQRIRYVSIPLVHLVCYLEYMGRIGHALVLRLRGFDIVFDRHPRFDYGVSSSWFDRLLGKTLYRFLFPAPHAMFLLTAPIAVILARKDEMDAAALWDFYEHARATKATEIDNTRPAFETATEIARRFYELSA